MYQQRKILSCLDMLKKAFGGCKSQIFIIGDNNTGCDVKTELRRLGDY